MEATYDSPAHDPVFFFLAHGRHRKRNILFKYARWSKQDRPELRHLLALRDRVGGNEADTGSTRLNIFSRLDEPGGHIVESPVFPSAAIRRTWARCSSLWNFAPANGGLPNT